MASKGGTLSTGYLLRMTEFAQERCGALQRQVKPFPSIG